MLSAKKVVQMAKKWQQLVVLEKRRITLETKLSHHDADQSTSPRCKEGHFVVYTIDRRRFMIPLEYLNNRIVMELSQQSEQEFGYTVDGPIILPCEATFMEYIMDLLRRGVSDEVERALLSSILLPCHHACSVQNTSGTINLPTELCGY